MSYPPMPSEKGLSFAVRHHDTYAAIDSATQSDCSGKAVLITGASKGVGRATALSYAAAGASVVVLAARSDLSSLVPEIEARAVAAGRAKPSVHAYKVDVQDPASVEAFAAQVTRDIGRLDILLNNAGYLEEWKSVADSDPTEWWSTWEINVRGVYLCTRAILPLLLRGGDKTIVNTTSIGAHAIHPGASSYQIGKLAVTRFCEYVMAEYADQGVLCFSVHPGGIPTAVALKMPKVMHDRLIDTPELAGDALVFLTQKKRDWLAGRYIDLTWDMPELLSREKEIVDGDKLKVRLIV